jgi:hypothetical protein
MPKQLSKEETDENRRKISGDVERVQDLLVGVEKLALGGNIDYIIIEIGSGLDKEQLKKELSELEAHSQ